MKLSELIKDYRQNNGLSQRQFAKRCDVTNGYIAMIEKGENPSTGNPITPNLKTLKKIAHGMNMTLDELLSQIEDMVISITDDRRSEIIDEVAFIMSELSEEDADKILDFARYRLSRKDK